ncbi:hypothetical protein Emag_000624 [Eimeria magna]
MHACGVARRQGREAGVAVCALSRAFSAAAAAVPLHAAAANPATVAAAARHTGALVSGNAVIDPPVQVEGGAVNRKLEKGDGGSSDAGGPPKGPPTNASKPPKRFPLGSFIFAAGAVGCAAWTLVYMEQHKMSFGEFLKDAWRRLDAQMTLTHERMYNAVEDAIAAAFPEDKEPLLPDFKDLNYPEYLPTLVLDFDGVLAKIGHDRAGGYKLRKRPYSEMMVNQLSHFFEVVVWNSDQPPVVQTALQQWALPVTACLNLDNMSRRNGQRIKDFSRLGRRPDRLIYVSCTDDGLDERFRANFIRVAPFEGTAAEMSSDTDLLDLINFLKHCSLSPDDVRNSIARFGGGEDGGVGRRFDAAKKAQESKANQRRSLGKLFGMGPTQGGSGFNPPQQTPSFGSRPGF